MGQGDLPRQAHPPGQPRPQGAPQNIPQERADAEKTRDLPREGPNLCDDPCGAGDHQSAAVTVIVTLAAMSS